MQKARCEVPGQAATSQVYYHSVQVLAKPVVSVQETQVCCGEVAGDHHRCSKEVLLESASAALSGRELHSEVVLPLKFLLVVDQEL